MFDRNRVELAHIKMQVAACAARGNTKARVMEMKLAEFPNEEACFDYLEEYVLQARQVAFWLEFLEKKERTEIRARKKKKSNDELRIEN